MRVNATSAVSGDQRDAPRHRGDGCNQRELGPAPQNGACDRVDRTPAALRLGHLRGEIHRQPSIARHAEQPPRRHRQRHHAEVRGRQHARRGDRHDERDCLAGNVGADLVGHQPRARAAAAPKHCSHDVATEPRPLSRGVRPRRRSGYGPVLYVSRKRFHDW